MSTLSDGPESTARRNPIRQPRLADMVAAEIRERIVDGDLEPGESLPKQEDLLAEFSVSLPSLREAMRILESEGLITVRRGKTGGALVHGPQADNAAQMLGLVLQSRHVRLNDLAVAIRALEPTCAMLCAQRPDRSEVVVRPLRALHERTLEVWDDPIEFTQRSRLFHEKIISACGNQTLILIVGALEHIWSSREEAWQEIREAKHDIRERGIEAHADIIDAIDRGDAMGVHQRISSHLEASTYYAVEGEAGVRVV